MARARTPTLLLTEQLQERSLRGCRGCDECLRKAPAPRRRRLLAPALSSPLRRAPVLLRPLLLLLGHTAPLAPGLALGAAARRRPFAHVSAALEPRGCGRGVVGWRDGSGAGFAFAARRLRGRRREAAARPGVIDVDQAGVLGEQTGVGGEEDVATVGGDVEQSRVGGGRAV